MPVSPGTRFGRYEIRSLLGAGGMGEVYLAQDTQLRRYVALKLLPSDFTKNESQLRRFEQEAYAASALNHPNILTIHEISSEGAIHYIATEFIDGVTLRQHLASPRMELREVLDIAVQVASALTAAHAAGIVHRDIKPDNIMLRRDGYVKVLDFGLAKLTETQTTGSDPEDAKTMPMAITNPGTVIGTTQYMSPEQAQGLKLDGRTDIWSLGVVLYEMVAGRGPFEGATPSEVVASILKTEPPPLARFSREVPTELERIVFKALTKDREERYQSVKDLLIDLRRLKQRIEFETELERSIPPNLTNRTTIGSDSGSRNAPPAIEVAQEGLTPTAEVAAPHSTLDIKRPTSEVKSRHRRITVALAMLVVAAVGVAYGLYKYSGGGKSQTKLTGSAPKFTLFTSFPGREYQPAFSPDGNQIAFVWSGEKDDNDDIYVKLLDAGAPLRLTTDPSADTSPAWSPDGRYVAFLRQSSEGGGFYIVPSLGGIERKLAEAFTDRFEASGQNLHWSPNGSSLAVVDKSSPQEPFSIFSLSRETGEKRRLTSPPAQTIGDSFPAISPDGGTLAFVRLSGSGVHDLYVAPSSGGEPKRISFDNTFINNVVWDPGGRGIIFSSTRGGNSGLWRISAAGGAPQQLAVVGQNIGSSMGLTISRQGNYMAYTQSSIDPNIWRLTLPSSSGQSPSPTRLISSTVLDFAPQYSPDGKRIAFQSNRSGVMELYLCDSEGANTVQLTYLNSPNTGTPRWSHDGSQIVFDSRLQGNAGDIFVISVEGGKPRRLTTEASEDIVPSWSRDGRWIYFGSNRSESLQIHKIPIEGGEAVQVTKGGGFEGFESMDGKFLYYAKGRDIPGIWRVPVEGGEESPVLDVHKAGYWRFWAVRDQGIYFITAETPSRPIVEFFNFATGKVAQLATLEKEVLQRGGSLSVSPDGQSLLYTQIDQSISDIMLMENFR
ncbi:MAG: PD40 domain-containing protein [Pyrinomonadaceae bacterium]|nr:PD40 domain-containing protein [Pyrinomonadaceae bacterium]